MSVVRYLLALLAIFVVSSGLRWILQGVTLPFDLFLIAVVFVALFRGPMAAQLFGLAAGLVQDVFSGEVIGISAISKTTVAFVIASLRQVVIIKGTPQRTLAFIFATAGDALIIAGVAAAFSLPAGIEPLALMLRSLVNAAIGVTAVLLLRRRMEQRPMTDEYEIA